MFSLSLFFFFLNCVDNQRNFLKMLFRPKYACHLTPFFQSPLCLSCSLHMAHAWLKSRGMMLVLGKILLVHMWFFSNKWSQTNVNRSYSVAEKGKLIISGYWLGSKNASREFQLNPRVSSLNGLTISFIRPMQILLPSKFTFPTSLSEISVSIFVSVLITTPQSKFFGTLLKYSTAPFSYTKLLA